MNWSTKLVVAISCLFTMSCGAMAGAGQAPKRIDYAPGKQIAVLANKAINESSGLAAGRTVPGVFWTHNDSGDRPRIFAFNAKGDNIATVKINGAARDWEDMAAFTKNNKHYLLLADVGDNSRKRETYTLYIIAEPKINLLKRDVKLSAKVVGKINFTYKDGPRDCESVAVDPANNLILLVSKHPRQTVYTLPLSGAGRAGIKKKLVAKPIANLPILWTTAMDISPDGLRAVILTYGCAYEYARKPGESWKKTFNRKGLVVNVPARKQGESICYGPDGKSLYLTSEKLPAPLFLVSPKKHK